MEDNSSAFVISDQGWTILDNIFENLSKLMSPKGYTDLKQRFYHLAKPSHLTRHTLINFVWGLIAVTDGFLRVERMNPIVDQLLEAYQVKDSPRQVIIDEVKRQQLLDQYTSEYLDLKLSNPLKDYIVKVTTGPPDNVITLATKLINKIGKVYEYIHLTTKELEANKHLLDRVREETSHAAFVALHFLADIEGICGQ